MCAWLLSDWAWVQGSEKQVRRPDKLSESKPGRQRDRVADQGPGRATSMDQDFIDSQRNTSWPEQLVDGVAKGIYSLGKGVASSVAGSFPDQGLPEGGFHWSGQGRGEGPGWHYCQACGGSPGLGDQHYGRDCEHRAGAGRSSRACRSPSSTAQATGRGVQFTHVSSSAVAETCKMGVTTCT